VEFAEAPVGGPSAASLLAKASAMGGYHSQR